MHAHFLGMHVFLYKYDSFIVAIVYVYAYDEYMYNGTYTRERYRGERERYRERLELKSFPYASQLCGTGL